MKCPACGREMSASEPHTETHGAIKITYTSSECKQCNITLHDNDINKTIPITLPHYMYENLEFISEKHRVGIELIIKRFINEGIENVMRSDRL